MSPGPHPRGKLRGLARGDLQAHTLLQGVACARGVCSRGILPQGVDPPMTATAGGSKHPTGMHSCHVCVVLLCRTVIFLLSTFVISDCYVYCFMS